MKEIKNIGSKFLRKGLVAIVLCVVVASCTKAEDRRCLKGAGEYTEFSIPLDSVRAFHLNKNIKYRIYQDNSYKVVIKGGSNLVSQIELDNRDNVLYVDNRNQCNFLRYPQELVEVEIHYPYLKNFYIDATDSVVFANKVISRSLFVEMRNGGGSLIADVDVAIISMVVSNGAGDFTLTGKAAEAELKIQNNGSANAIGFRSVYTYIYQNSTADLFINLDNSSALIVIDGTGDVLYKNVAGNIISKGVGSGRIIKL
ncbi:MAG: hypothetical protein GQ574_23400 [Crocinitomix sp.]|nr:hypothetical protein [Crocinitomix sp.]